MPTVYASYIQDGKITELRDFALLCARAFGATIRMRDDPLSTPIPERFEPHTSYYDKNIAVAQEALNTILSLSAEECLIRTQEAHAAELARRAEREKTRLLHKKRYEDMLSKIYVWNPPKDIEPLCEFMIKQLTESLDFDCSPWDDEPLPDPDGEEWRRTELAEAERNLKYYSEKRDEEIRRTEDRNKWLASLRTSLVVEQAA